jgi:homoserine kinase type II
VNSSYEVRFSSARLFLRLYEEQDLQGAEAEARRLAHLASKGVSTPAPLPRKDGAFVGVLAHRPAALFPWCSGDMRCLRCVTHADGGRVGRALGELHQAGRDAPRETGRFEPKNLRDRLDHIASSNDSVLAGLSVELRRRLEAWTEKRTLKLPRGLIHGDLFRDNVLWTEAGEIAALLDFESASDGVLAYDLMVTILAWSFKDGFDASVARAIADGYQSVRPLSDAECGGLLAEGAIAALRFTITRITDEAMRARQLGRPPRSDKDYRRFLSRLDHLEALGKEGVARLLLG